MFPLGMVLLPGGLLPLHVFEPRYRQMLDDCLIASDPPEFGQVLITRGREAGGGDERALVGTVAQVLQVEPLDEGRAALLAAGTRRIRIVEWLPDDPYPIAEVADWRDEDDMPSDFGGHLEAATSRVRAARVLAARLDDVTTQVPADDSEELADVSDDPVLATHHLAALAPIGPADRYRLLTASGPSERLRRLDTILDDVEAMMNFRLS
jgi:Lon protease-like protein